MLAVMAVVLGAAGVGRREIEGDRLDVVAHEAAPVSEV
jgi:hypothetical protein